MIPQQARTRIRKHLRRRGAEPVQLSTRVVRIWWALLNDAVFYGKLQPPVKVKLIQHRQEHAWAIQESDGRISISICPIVISRQLFLTVLVHEMVHAWEYQHHSSMGHGKRFFTWKKRIHRTTTLILDKILDENDYI